MMLPNPPFRSTEDPGQSRRPLSTRSTQPIPWSCHTKLESRAFADMTRYGITFIHIVHYFASPHLPPWGGSFSESQEMGENLVLFQMF